MLEIPSSAAVAAAYTGLRSRMVDLLRDLPPEAGNLVAPHCPAWTVQQLASHLVGVPDDVLAGRLEGVTTEPWTQAQVDRRNGRSLAELADEWESLAAFDQVLESIQPPTNAQVVFDAVTHEHDLRHAVDRPGERESAAIDVAHAFLCQRFGTVDPALAAQLEAGPASRFDVVRALSGRRTRDQIADLGLDPVRVAAVLEHFPVTVVPEPLET